MVLFRSLLLAGLFTLTVSTSAEAKSAPVGTVESLEFVVTTGMPVVAGSENMMSLCHLVKQTHLFLVPVWFESEGYVLSDSACTGDKYYRIDAERLAEARKLGLIPAEIPEVPSLSAKQKSAPLFWAALAAIAAIMVIAYKLRNRSDRRKSTPSPVFTTALTSALCHAAQLSVLMREMKPGQISGMILNWTGTKMSAEKLAQFIGSGQAKLSSDEIARIGEGLSDLEKERVIVGTVVILGPEANMMPEAIKFVSDLGRGLRLTEQQYNRIFAQRPESDSA